MNIYYIDYENVNSFGLKGVQLLTDDCQVNILYSKKADNVKIDTLSELMKSKAEIHFIPVHVGTPNALDFQLITLLFLHYEKGNHYYIISKDSGYDCCIKTAQDCGAPDVKRFRDIESAVRDDSHTGPFVPSSGLPAFTGSPDGSPDTLLYPGTGSTSAVPEDQASVSELSSSAAAPAAAVAPMVSDSEAVSSEIIHSEAASSETSPRHSRRRRRSSRSGEKRAEAAESQQKLNTAGDNAQPVPAQPSPEQDSISADAAQNDSKQESAGRKAQSDPDPRYPAEKISEVILKRCGFEPDEKQLSVVRDVLLKAKNKQQFYSFMVRRCGQKEGLALYHTIRCAYNDLLAVEGR